MTSYSIGTKYTCVERNQHSDCKSLPLSGPDGLSTLTSVSPSVKSLSQWILAAPSLETLLALGLGFILLSSISYAGKFVFPPIRFAVPILSLAGLGCFIAFAVFTFVIVAVGYGVKESLGGSLKRGYVFVGAIGNLTCSALHAIITIICLVVGI
ncbi:hypothetical protein BGZ63DRAFT_397654 [Mariannaea sp. PMI_226]|nr:hypothetical protein BGZ63DRAFT_397654 [Mariannaea sp. PMI_226]